MRRLTLVLGLLGASSAALAQPAGGEVTGSSSPAPAPEAAAPIVGYAALPGANHVASAETLPAGMISVALLGGYGYRKDLLAKDETLDRGIGDFAIAFGITDMLAVGLSLDGRYDKHFHLGPADDGYVGDPHLVLRFGKRVGNNTFGAQAGVWVPGKDAPSIAGSAISVDVRANGTFAAGPGTLSASVGFRLDNSAKSVDHPEMLSAQDRVSLGVSDYNAVVGGVAFAVPAGKAYVQAELSTDLFIGSGAPGPIVRGGVSGGLRLNDSFTLLAFIEGAKVPGLSYASVAAGNITLIPYEPVITGGLGLQGHFGGPSKASAGTVTTNVVKEKVEVIEYADVSGEVSDENGKPIVGAKVTVKLKNHTGTGVTDDKGLWKVEKLPVGKTIDGATNLDDTGAEVSVEVDGKKPAKTTLVLQKGSNTSPKIGLEAVLPPGQLRAIVKSLVTGKPITGATIKIEPGGKTATSDAEGKFTVDLAPGQYKITVTSPGLAEQQLDVTIDPNGVAIKNIDLHK